MSVPTAIPDRERWALLHFSVVGQLLAAAPPKGALRAEIAKLAARESQHPITGSPVRFGVSTVERWLHRARRSGRTRCAYYGARYCASRYAEQHAELAPGPSYSAIRRFFKAQGLHKRPRLTSRRTTGAERGEARSLPPSPPSGRSKQIRRHPRRAGPTYSPQVASV
jgi:putative transposase